MQDWLSNQLTSQNAFWGLGVALIAFSVVWIYYSTRRDMSGGSKTRVAGILKRYAALNNCKLLNNVTLAGKEGTPAHADHVLIGYFGVLVFNVRGEVGTYYGDDTEDAWAVVDTDGTKHRVRNPIRDNAAMIEAIRAIFVKNSIYNIQTEQLVVVLPSFNAKREFCIKASLPVINVRKLTSRLGSSHFESDNGVNVEKLTTLIQNGMIR